MKTKQVVRSALFVIVLAVYSAQSFAQTEQQKLITTILHLDSAFWKAYNNCDTAHFIDFVTDDVEFYHDKGGVTSDAKSLIEALDKNICGNTNSHLRREAVAGTVKVYPMQNGDQIYGAIISGEHEFYLTEKGKPEYHSGTANFTQLWLLKNGIWKMARILSYNHHAPEYINTRGEIELPGKQLDRLTGTYKSAQSGTMTVLRENKILVLKGGDNIYKLYPQTGTSFFTKERDLVFEFVKDATGKPFKMVVKEHGAVADELLFEK
jgi:ketosteroid isomerase-like protein